MKKKPKHNRTTRRAITQIQRYTAAKMAHEMVTSGHNIYLSYEKFMTTSYLRGGIRFIAVWVLIAFIGNKLPATYQYKGLFVLWSIALIYMGYKNLRYRRRCREYEQERNRVHDRAMELINTI